MECGSSSTISSGLQDTGIEISIELGDSLQQVATRIAAATVALGEKKLWVVWGFLIGDEISYPAI